MKYCEKVYETRLLYASTRACPQVMRFEITLTKPIVPDLLQLAVDRTMKRYPYYAVSMVKKEGDYYFVGNELPLLIHPYDEKPAIGSKENNGYLLGFDYQGKTIGLDFAHHLSDGDGSYHVLRTLLHHYVSLAYGLVFPKLGIRIDESDLQEGEMEELQDIAIKAKEKARPDTPLTLSGDFDPALCHYVFDEDAFMEKTKCLGATPNIMAALFIEALLRESFPEIALPVRVVICVNQRNALGKPSAHQCLVGGAILEFDRQEYALPPSQKAQQKRQELKEKTTREAILDGLASLRDLRYAISARSSDEERASFSTMVRKYANESISATVSYVGKANFGASEAYIEDFVTVAPPSSKILIELSAVDGRIFLDFIQYTKNDELAKRLESVFEEFGLAFIAKSKRKLNLPQMVLPWVED